MGSLRDFGHFLLYVSFGSDQFEPYRATYSWGANQMAHAMMGFFLATVWYQWTGLRAVLGPLGRPPLYRWIPFLLPALKILPDYLYARTGYSAAFPFDSAEFFWDKMTDLTFWSLGMFLALALFAWPWPATGPRGGPMKWAIVVLLAVPLVGWAYYLMTYWQEVKNAFDVSNLPMIYKRLVNFPAERIEPESVATVNAYYGYIQEKDGESPPLARHVILTGGTPLDRSMLAVTLGVEHTARAKEVYYTSAVKLIEDPIAALSAADHDHMECVIIDDLNVALRPELTPTEQRVLEMQERLERGLAPQSESAPAPVPFQLDEPEGRMAFEATAREARTKEAFRDVLERMKDHARQSNIGTIWVLSTREGADGGGIAWWKGFIKENFSPDADLIEIRLQ